MSPRPSRPSSPRGAVVLALVDPEKDAGAGFRLARGPAHDNACGADVDDTQLDGGDIVAIETASRPQSAAGMEAAVRDAHIGAGNGKSA